MSKDLSPVDRIKQRALSAMTEATRKVAIEMVERRQRRNSTEVLYYYDCGELMKQVYTRPDIYGADGAKQIAEYVGIQGGERYLRELRRFVDAYKREDIIAQLKTPMTNGNPLEMTHFMTLARVATGKRATWFKRIRQNNWTTRQLIDELAIEVPATGTGGAAGRPPEVPASTVGALQKTTKLFEKTITWLGVFESQVFPRLDDEEATEPLLATLDKSRAAVKSAIAKATSVLAHLDELADKIEEPAVAAAPAIDAAADGDDWAGEPDDPEADDFEAAVDDDDAEAAEAEDEEDDGGFRRAATIPPRPAARPASPARPAAPPRPPAPARPAAPPAPRGRR